MMVWLDNYAVAKEINMHQTMTERRLMPDGGGALRPPGPRIAVPLDAHGRMLLLSLEEARTLRDWLAAADLTGEQG